MRTLLLALAVLCLFGAAPGAQAQGRYVSLPAAHAPSVVSASARYMGGNPTSMRRNWCAEFLGGILERTGHLALASKRAIDYLRYPGRRVSRPVPGAIMVMRHHVGFVKGVDARGNVILISGNHSRRVGVGTYSRHKALAFIMPR